jgi:hypothetical protein
MKVQQPRNEMPAPTVEQARALLNIEPTINDTPLPAVTHSM